MVVTARVDSPEECGAFIEIDTDSDGGRAWKQSQIPTRLQFAFFTDEEWQDEVQVNYSAHDVIGRSEQYQVYANTASREIPLNLTFHVQGGKGEDYERAILREVRQKVDWCRALGYPRYVGRRMLPPPVVLVHLGRLYSAQGLPMRCIVQNVSVTYNGPVSPDTHASHGADVAMQLLRVAESAADLYDIQRVYEGF